MSEVKFSLHAHPWDPLPSGYRESGFFHKVRKPLLTSELSLQERKRIHFLTVANSLLARLRREGIVVDHEHFSRREPSWHGAVLVVRDDGRLFADVGKHLDPTDFAIRNCAEERAIAAALTPNRWRRKNIQGIVHELILEGGQTRPWDAPPIWIYPEEKGIYVTPCGACRDKIHRCGISGGKTKVTMFPLNDGSWTIIPFRGDKARLLYKKMGATTVGEAWTTTIGDLLPELTVEMPHRSEVVGAMAGGWGFILSSPQSSISHSDLLKTSFTEINKMPPQQAMGAINKIIMEQMRFLYHQTNGSIHNAHVVVARINDRSWHMGVSYLNPPTSNHHTAIDNLIGELRKLHPEFRFTDVVSTHCDYDRLKDGLIWQPGLDLPVHVQMLTGSERERIKKCAHEDSTDLYGNLLVSQNARIHEIILNNPAHFDTQQHVIERELSFLLPNGYINPRVLRALAAAHCPTCAFPA